MTVIEVPKPGFVKACWIDAAGAHSLSLAEQAVMPARFHVVYSEKPGTVKMAIEDDGSF